MLALVLLLGWPRPILPQNAASELRVATFVLPGEGQVRAVGPEFDRNDVGFVLPLDSALRKRVNSQLLALHEDGTHSRIYARWFGAE